MGERWVRVGQLFEATLPLTAEQRAALLLRECADDPALSTEVETLLQASDNSGDFLGRRPEAVQRTADRSIEESALTPGAVVDVWRVVRLIGRGGMSEVYEVERADDHYQQRAALKLLRISAPGSLERFRAEREILARLDHPGIAHLLDGGMTEQEQPYAVMEYVDGESLVAWCAANASPFARRLDVVLQICDAVAHAHRNLVVHRDLKPSNILVDREGRVHLLDFGIAKLLDPGNWSGGIETLANQRPLTPDYCAPEQLAGEPVTTATDVHAIGVLLFELMCGERPWQLQDQPVQRALRTLLDTPAPRASIVAETSAAAPVPAKLLRGDLDAIIAVCLRREPQHRYATVNALKLDIERHLASEPIAARAGQRSYAIGRFLHRNRWAVAGVAVLLAALALGFAGTLWQAQRAQQQADRATAVQNFLIDIFRANSSDQPDPVKARQTSARDLLDIGASKISSALGDTPQTKLTLLDVLARLYDNLALLDQATGMRQQAVAIERRLHGADSVELADALTLLGIAMHGARNARNEREAVLIEANAILDRRRDFDSPARARLLQAEAEFFQISDMPRALGYARRSVALHAQWPESKELGEAWYMQGLIESYSGQLHDAAASLDKAIAITERTGSERDPQLIYMNYQRAETLSNAREFVAAEQSARRALALSLAISGAESVDVARAQMQLASLEFNTGRCQEALALMAEAKQLILRIRGLDDSFHTPAIFFLAGKMEAQAGILDQGLSDMTTALAIVDRHNPGTLFTATIRESLALALLEMGRGEEAVVRLDEARRTRTGIGQESDNSGFNINLALRIRFALDT
ncbi:MAG: serine/threonine-protein kinase, partial [Dokdonella sp.]